MSEYLELVGGKPLDEMVEPVPLRRGLADAPHAAGPRASHNLHLLPDGEERQRTRAHFGPGLYTRQLGLLAGPLGRLVRAGLRPLARPAEQRQVVASWEHHGGLRSASFHG